jgi:hypothetical protein
MEMSNETPVQLVHANKNVKKNTWKSFVVLGFELSALHLLGKHSPTWTQASYSSFPSHCVSDGAEEAAFPVLSTHT